MIFAAELPKYTINDSIASYVWQLYYGNIRILSELVLVFIYLPCIVHESAYTELFIYCCIWSCILFIDAFTNW